MRIAIGTKWLSEPYTGVGMYALELVKILIRLQAELAVQVVAVHRGAPVGPLTAGCQVMSYKGLPGPLWLLSQERALRRAATVADIVHEPYLGVRGKLPVPLVVTIHDTMPLDFPGSVPLAFRVYFRRVMPGVLERAAAIMVNSHDTKACVQRHYGVAPDKIHVAHHGADHMAEGGRTEATDASLARWGLSPSSYFVSVGTLPTKNLPLTLAGFARFLDQVDPGAKLVVVGRPPKSVALREEEARLRARGAFVEIPAPSFEELRHLYAGARAVVQPSLHEGFGLVPLEAMRMGAPVIVSDAGALPEICGDAAIAVSTNDPDGLCRAMEQLEEPSRRAQLIQKGRERGARYTWEATVRATVEVYRSLV